MVELLQLYYSGAYTIIGLLQLHHCGVAALNYSYGAALLRECLRLRRASITVLLRCCSVGSFLRAALFARLPAPSQGFYGRIFAGLQRWIIPARGYSDVLWVLEPSRHVLYNALRFQAHNLLKYRGRTLGIILAKEQLALQRDLIQQPSPR